MLWPSLSLPWQACLEEAWAAYCAGSVPIGAVITDRAGQILSRGRNRIYDTAPTEQALWGTRLAHAEMNALALLDHRAIDLRECILYTTTEPCPMCIGAIRMCHVGEVRYAARDNLGGSVALLEATPFMQLRRSVVVGPGEPLLEALVVALHTEFILRQGNPLLIDLIGTWTVISPLGGRLGYAVFHSGALQQLCASRATTAEMITLLEEIALV